MRTSGLGTKLVTVAIVATLILGAYLATETKNDAEAIILFTGDVHCAYNSALGYDGVSAYKQDMMKECRNVLLVDTGDYVQGNVAGALSKGKYLTDFMDFIDYDIVGIGNHEFDYGADNLWDLLRGYDFETVCCNITYTGEKEDPMDFVQPYTIREFGTVKIGFIGVITPSTLNTTSSKNITEDGKLVYDFCDGNEGKDLYDAVQNSIDSCRKLGATHVILLSHLGNTSYPPYTSVDVAKNTTGLTCILDGHDHNVIEEMKVNDKNGHEVSISSTGADLDNLGCLRIMKNGNLSFDLVSSDEYTKKDPSATAYMKYIDAAVDERVGKKAFTLPVDLPIRDSNGARMVLNQETALGDFITDSFRVQNGADIALAGGGGIKGPLYKGDVTYKDVLNAMPFQNSTSVLEVTGQTILYALEMSCHVMTEETSSGSEALGEFDGFQSVSGLKFDVDASIESPVILDQAGNFVGLKEGAQKRVSNVRVLDSETGEYVTIDVNAKYIVTGPDFTLIHYGLGFTMFKDARVILPETTLDFVALIDYANSLTQEQIEEMYSTTDGRITRI